MVAIASTGNTVRVYKFQIYNIVTDEMVTSTRLAQEHTIERIGAVRMGVPFEVPLSDVDAEGFTSKNYSPVQGV
ncbi:hypothetical protein HH212_12125 [Massilia forsythiae]|uniref:Uncharacterized protein n=1 Tax=Massilia forsythiae TaxID=2728020 RepID=A0A7Z2VWG9_9BURK|nr:hypothetical protein [Massilia forsythiae]QJE00676.1 hypothetical protein HH212_12125 [Massilia forsythiae]